MANAIVTTTTTTTTPTAKRRRLADRHHHRHHNYHHHHHHPLLPGLPNDTAQLCLFLVQPSLLFSVCRSWRRLIYSPSFPPFLSLYALLSSSSSAQSDQNSSSSIDFFSFDPISSKWHVLPPPPSDPPLRLLLRHPSFISRNLPIQSVAVSGKLILLAATTHNFNPALSRPLIFDPKSHNWVFGAPLATPRRWCAAGSSRGVVYVASGIGSRYNSDVARSVEKWDLDNHKTDHHCWSSQNCSEGKWEKLSELRDGRFSRDAIDAVGWRRKLCMVNIKGNAPKEGAVYDVEKDRWEVMPEGMIGGWMGPAAAMDEEVMYMVDEGKGVLRRYNPDSDVWEEIMESERLRGAEQISAGGGRVCVVCGGGKGIVVVDVEVSPARLWEVDLPAGFHEAVAVHILPRTSSMTETGGFSVLASTSMEMA